MSTWSDQALSPPTGRRPAGHQWFLLLPILTFGYGTFAMPLWAAARTVPGRRGPVGDPSVTLEQPAVPSVRVPLFTLLALAAGLAGVTGLVLLLRSAAGPADRDLVDVPWFTTTVWLGMLSVMLRSVAPPGEAGEATAFLGVLATLVSLALLAGGVVMALRWRETLFPPVVDPRIALLNVSTVPAPVAQAQGRRALRAEYREVARRDPLLAREIGVGRIDPTRTFDDGGLVDLNGASVDTLVASFELTREQAEALVALRERRGGLASVDELVVYGDLPMGVVDRLREYAVFLPR